MSDREKIEVFRGRLKEALTLATKEAPHIGIAIVLADVLGGFNQLFPEDENENKNQES